MQMFILDTDPILSAQMHCDKHVVKMPTETAQILCAVFHINGIDPDIIPYRLSHKHHPCVQWACNSQANFEYTVKFGKELCNEYSYRYGKFHGAAVKILWAERNMWRLTFPNKLLKPFALAMPPEYIDELDPVGSYRRYYVAEKSEFARWKKNRPAPDWYTDAVNPVNS